jgi:hypothetical protein
LPRRRPNSLRPSSGRHEQAAYRGPTPDNPSLSLKKRLKRARFFDQRERMAGVQPNPSPGSSEAMMAHARAAREAHQDEQPIFWPHDRKEAELGSTVESR